MRTLICALVLMLCAALTLAQAPASSIEAARQELNLGVQAFKNAHYEQAIEHFQAAVNHDPDLMVARLYLGVTYAQLYIPGVDTEENIKNAEQAIAEFRVIVDSPRADDAQKLHSMKGTASLLFNMKHFEESADWYRRVTAADPKDAEAYYSIGVIKWTQAYQPRMVLRAKLGLQPTDQMPAGPDCAALRAKNAPGVEDGMRMMSQALELRPDYDDAMAYLNLLYRERADYECDDPQARRADLKKADEWVDRVMAVKKRNAEQDAAPQTSAQQNGRPQNGGSGNSDRHPHTP
jgi:tetratricopeptide (TPR) repeat protein